MTQPEQPKRFQGNVKWFDFSKGFGFIKLITDEPKVEGEKDDIFFYYKSIRLNNNGDETEGYRSLKEGEKVEFIIKEVENRKQAFDIVKVK